MVGTERKSERIGIRTPPSTKALLRQAADLSHGNLSKFLLDAGISAAEDTLIDQRIVWLDDDQWQAFQDILERPVVDKPRLARLLADRSVLE